MRIPIAVFGGGLVLLAATLPSFAQGVVRGAQDGAGVGNRAAGPVGGVVGGAVGGVVGGVAGGVKGVLGVPQDTRVRRSTKRRVAKRRR
jgi:phage tail tape-measure protein